jgi:hypothetical protein
MEVVMQQSVLFNVFCAMWFKKVKTQSESQKQVLKKYLDTICQNIQNAAQSLQQ